MTDWDNFFKPQDLMGEFSFLGPRTQAQHLNGMIKQARELDDKTLYKRNADVRAFLHFLGTEFGGRQGIVNTGYRVQMFFNGKNRDVVVYFGGGCEVMGPGASLVATIAFMTPEVSLRELDNNTPMPFELREGRKVVAVGSITEIITKGYEWISVQEKSETTKS